MNTKFTGTQIAILVALAIGVVVVFCIGGMLLLVIFSATSKPSSQNKSAEIGATSPPTSTASNPSLTFEQITSTAKQLTEIKRNDYYKSLIGKTIHWTGTVADVSDSGEVRIRIVNTISYDVVLQGVPATTYTALNLSDSVDFDGTIIDVSDMFGSGIPRITVKSTTLNRQANTINPTPTNPNQSLTFEQITSAAKQLTEIKRNEYYKSLVGKTIHWTGKVADVSNNGDIHVRIVSTISYEVVLQGVPKATYTTLNLNDRIVFDGTIIEVNDIFGSGIPSITIRSTSVKSP